MSNVPASRWSKHQLCGPSASGRCRIRAQRGLRRYQTKASYIGIDRGQTRRKCVGGRGLEYRQRHDQRFSVGLAEDACSLDHECWPAAQVLEVRHAFDVVDGLLQGSAKRFGIEEHRPGYASKERFRCGRFADAEWTVQPDDHGHIVCQFWPVRENGGPGRNSRPDRLEPDSQFPTGAVVIPSRAVVRS